MPVTVLHPLLFPIMSNVRADLESDEAIVPWEQPPRRGANQNEFEPFA